MNADTNILSLKSPFLPQLPWWLKDKAVQRVTAALRIMQSIQVLVRELGPQWTGITNGPVLR